MPKENYTHVAVVLDRSGSMSVIRKDVVLGLRDFIERQKAEKGEATFTLAQFDNDYEMIYDMIPLQDVKDIGLIPGGSTALLDAMGTTMEQVRNKIIDMKEEDRPSKAVFVFITDGEENASKTYSKTRVFEMIEALKNDKTTQWDVVFMGATQESIQEGGSLGVRSASTMQWDATSQGTKCAFDSLSRSMTSYRSKAGSYDFADKDPELNNDDKTSPYHIKKV